jgi:hypothetical protein
VTIRCFCCSQPVKIRESQTHGVSGYWVCKPTVSIDSFKLCPMCMRVLCPKAFA